jgi:hypothetical protein
MAEILGIFALTALLGYLNAKDDLPIDSVQVPTEIPKELIPNGKNIYTSDRVNEIRDTMQKMADDNFEKSKNPQHTGILPPLFNTYGTRGQKIEFEERVKAKQMAEINEFNKLANVFGDKNGPLPEIVPVPTGNANYSEESPEVSILTGLPLDRSHSNMTPFFGSTVKQRTEEFSNVPLIERFTGTEARDKKEIASLYDKKQQNIYGSPAFTTQIDINSRYIPGVFRENELPFEQTRVKAPIAWGPEDTIKPQFKTIDELVVNSKETYKGKLIHSKKLDGGRGEERGITGKVNKNRPETAFEWGEDRLFKTTGEMTAAQLHPDYNQIFRDQKTTAVSYFGNTKAQISKTDSRLVTGSHGQDPEGGRYSATATTIFADPKKRLVENDPLNFIRNNGGSSQLRDNPTGHIMVQQTDRDNPNTQILGGSSERSGPIQQLYDLAKITTKESVLKDRSGDGIHTAPFKKQKSTQLDSVKTTNKEMNVESKYDPQAHRENGFGYLLHQQSMTAKTTNKETGIYEAKGAPVRTVGETSRVQYSNAEFANQLDNDGRISGPEKFNISASKNLVNLYVKDREMENKRDSNPDYINKSITTSESIGELTYRKGETEITNRTFGIVNELHDQLKSNSYVNRTRT